MSKELTSSTIKLGDALKMLQKYYEDRYKNTKVEFGTKIAYGRTQDDCSYTYYLLVANLTTLKKIGEEEVELKTTIDACKVREDLFNLIKEQFNDDENELFHLYGNIEFGTKKIDYESVIYVDYFRNKGKELIKK